MSADVFAQAIALGTTVMTFSGLVYLCSALWAARGFRKRGRAAAPAVWPSITVMKPIKGWDAGRYAAFASHCSQVYQGELELLLGLSDPDDVTVLEDVARLQREFPAVAVRAVPCPGRLGTNGKVSTLLQMLPHAAGDVVVINDADIVAPAGYLASIASELSVPGVGLVTAPYRANAAMSIPSRLEALGIATDFFPSVLMALKMDRGMRFGLGSTLGLRRSTLEEIGGLEPLLALLADDYEVGVRVFKSGKAVTLLHEAVETSVPAYDWSGFWEHQTRWYRTVRDARPAAYVGVVFTFAVPWALLNVVATAFALPAFTLLSLVLLARVALALSVGVGILRDGQVLRDLWLVPLRDCVSAALWAWSYASDEVVWRGEKFRVRDGQLIRAEG